MKKLFNAVSFVSLLLIAFACNVSNQDTTGGGGGTNKLPSHLLVFSKTEGVRHTSIPTALDTIRHFAGNDNSFSITETEDASAFTAANLKSYGAVLFLNTSGDVLDNSQQEALKDFIEAGGGFMGVHSAIDTEANWPWYGEMIGARADGHSTEQEAVLHVLARHQTTEYLPGNWTRTDVWYNFKDIQDDINPVIALDESTYEGGTNSDFHPIAWYHTVGEGRVFYTGGGHTTGSYSEQFFVRHLLAGIKYVLHINY